MKKFIITAIMVAMFAAGSTIKAQNNQNESLGLPGDNLNLYAVMKLFQDSKTLEEFEQRLNDPNSTINNLDLNGDNLVDYIKVIDNVDGDVHNIVLQVAVSPKENQDVAVFTVQRFHNGQVQIQLTGDEQLYGKDYIIEPVNSEANRGETPNPGYSGNTRTVNDQVQVATWPLVSFIFLPTYSAWHSSWYWGYYPSYWHPWRPFSWNYYYGYQYNWNHYYYGHYHQSNIHSYSRWNDYYYTGRRSYSPDVHHRIDMGYYKETYSHPEQRKEGEASFAKVHPDQYRRSTSSSSGNNSSINHRPTSTMTSRPVTNTQSGNNTVINRRSTTTVTDKSVTNRPYDKNTEINKRSTTTVTDKSVTNPHPDNGAVVNRRSTTTATDKPIINSHAGQNAGTNHPQVQTKTTVVKSSNRKNETNKRSVTTEKKDNNIKESENKDSNHREK
jgi:hypothetical protein